MAPNLWHESLAIKAARHGRLETNDFGRILGFGQAIGQFAQLIRAKLTAPSQLQRVLNHFGLLVRRQLVDFFNYFRRSHRRKLLGS